MPYRRRDPSIPKYMYWEKSRSKWVVQVKLNRRYESGKSRGKQVAKTLGRFDSIAEAVAARDAWLERNIDD